MKKRSATEHRRFWGNVGPKVREVRKALGLTLTDLSRRTKISVSQLSKIETGKTHPTIPALVKISTALDRSPTFFFLSEAESPRSLATLMPLVGAEGEAVTAFAALVRESSKGRMTLQILPSVILDRFAEVPDTLLAGTIDMVTEGLAFYQTYAEALVPASLPFCFRDWPHYESFLHSEFFQERVVSVLRNKGVRFLDSEWAWRRAPQVLVSRRPVFSVADLIGLKVRVYDSAVTRSFWDLFGARPVFVPWLETRRALAEGAVDGVVVASGLLATTGFTEVAKYVTFVDLCDAMVSTVNIAIGEGRYQLLAPDIQRVMSEAATQIAKDATSTLARHAQDGLAACVAEHGAVVSRVNLRPFRERAWEVIRKLERRGAWSKGLFALLQNAVPQGPQ